MDQVPSLKTVLFKYRKTSVFQYILMLLFTLFFAWSVYRFIVQPFPDVSWYAVCSLAAGIFFSSLIPAARIRVKHTILKDFPGEKIGKFEKNFIVSETEKIIENHPAGEKPNIYIIQSRTLGPFAVDTLLFNSFKNINAIYLPEYLFSIMNIEEIKGILLHELAHFTRYIYPLNKFRFPYLLAMPFAPLCFINYMHPKMYLIFYIIMIAAGYLFQGRILRTDNRPVEHLADYSAAEKIGILPAVNGLIAAVRYNAMLEYVNKRILLEIKKDNRLSLKRHREIFESFAEKLPAAVLSNSRLKKEVRKFIRSEYSEYSPEKLSPEQADKEARAIDNMLFYTAVSDNRKTADWSRFDNVIKNKKIDPEEFEGFVEYLKNNEDKLLIKSANEDPFLIKLSESHPLLRNRILFLYKNREGLKL